MIGDGDCPSPLLCDFLPLRITTHPHTLPSSPCHYICDRNFCSRSCSNSSRSSSRHNGCSRMCYHRRLCRFQYCLSYFTRVSAISIVLYLYFFVILLWPHCAEFRIYSCRSVFCPWQLFIMLTFQVKLRKEKIALISKTIAYRNSLEYQGALL